jgi:thioredoxin 2
MIVECGNCRTKNRIPEIRQHEGPLCGRCGREIDLADRVVPVELGDHDLQSFLSSSRLPVMVDFYSPDCGPCRSLAPVIDAMARRFHRKVVIAKLDTSRNQASALRHGIRGVPTLLFFSGGVLRDQVVGVPPQSMLLEKLEKLAAGK